MPASLGWSTKDPSDIAPHGIDWSRELAAVTPAETIATVVWTVPAGLTGGTQSVSGSVALIVLSAGVAGADYEVTCRITTSGGRTLERSASLAVRDL